MDGKNKSKTATTSMSTTTEMDAVQMAMSVFLVECDDLFEDVEELPDLQQIPDSDNESDSDLDEFSAMFEDEQTDDEALLPGNSVVRLMEKAENLPNEAYTTIYMKNELENPINVNLYDSGASHHMSGHHHHFVNFTTTGPHLITATDKCTFDATGKGDIIFKENGFSKILLCDALYAPTMRVTLVSISLIMAAGSVVVFSGPSCQLYNSSQKLLGCIEVNQGLY